VALRILKATLAAAAAAALALALSSCASSKPKPQLSDMESLSAVIKEAAVSEDMLTKAAEFRNALSPACRERGAFIGAKAMRLYSGRYDMLAARCVLLGFNRVYLAFHYDDTESRDHCNLLRDIIHCFHDHNIEVYAVVDDPIIYAGKGGISSFVSKILWFNKWSKEIREFDGIIIMTTPESMTVSDPRHTQSVLYQWNKNSYGKDRDNDMLMKAALQNIETAKAEAGKLPVAHAAWPSSNDDFEAKKLTCGGVGDFVKRADYIILTVWLSDRSDIMDAVSDELLAAGKKESVMLCLSTKTLSYGGDRDRTLSWKSWFKFIKDLEYVVKSSKKTESFRGLAFMEYTGLEKMWENQ
jgi:hypothetical protein